MERHVNRLAWHFLLLCVLTSSAAAQTGIASYRQGDGTGEDWEPAILADGSYVYTMWPHYLPTSYADSSGATCMRYAPRGGGKNSTASSYMYFQVSHNGVASTVQIPRCPVYGGNVDAQLALGANHRIYAGYMDGNQQYTPIVVIHSDDHGSTWSVPVDVTNGRRGDKDVLLVDANNNVMVAYENGGKQYVSVSTNGGASFAPRQVNIAPSGVAL